jgi:hypothetical protein
MQFLMELWLPILVSGVAVFILSALAWMLLPHHRSDWKKIPNEDAVSAAIRAGNVPPGLYSLPWAEQSQMNSPEMQAKFKAGPRAFITVAGPWDGKMGGTMMKSLLGNIVVSIFAAYVAYHAMGGMPDSASIFRVVSTVGFMAYAFGTLPDSVWFSKPWGSWAKNAADSLAYGLAMGGVFCWLW